MTDEERRWVEEHLDRATETNVGTQRLLDEIDGKLDEWRRFGRRLLWVERLVWLLAGIWIGALIVAASP